MSSQKHSNVQSVVQSLSCVQLFVTPWTTAHQASLFSTISQSLLKFMFTELVIISNHLIFCCPLLLLPSIFLSIKVFSDDLALHIRLPKYWVISSIFPMNIQGWFPLGLTGLNSLQSKELSKVISSTTIWKHCVNYIPMTYLFYNWKFVPFDPLHPFSMGFPGGSVVKNHLSVHETQEMQVWSLGQEDPLE